MSDLDSARRNFLDQLHATQPDMVGYEGFVQYWRQVQAEARRSEDLGQLDRWAKDIARDKDRVAELRERQQQAAASQMAPPETMVLLTRLLLLLDDVYGLVRKRLATLRDQLGMWVFLAGPGTKSKPKPLSAEGTREEKDEQGKEAALAKKEESKKPTKTKAQ